MNRFLYFISTSNALNLEGQARTALPHLFDDGAPVLIRQTFDGPGGAPGVLVALGEQPPEYKAAAQEWREFAGAWIGWERGAMPGPEDLERAHIIPGYLVRLGDGQQWQCPIALYAPGRGWSALPKVYTYDKDGQPVETIQRRYESLFKMAGQIVDTVRDSDGASVDVDLGMKSEMDLCVEALAVNYRLSWREASALELLTTEAIHAISCAIIDLPAYKDLINTEKKTPSESLAS